MHIGQPEIAARVMIRELLVIKAEAVQDGCLKIVNVNRILHDMESKVIRDILS